MALRASRRQVVVGFTFAGLVVALSPLTFSREHITKERASDLPLVSVPLVVETSTTSTTAATSTPLKLLVVGDMLFDRYIRQVNDRRGSDFLFSCIDPLLKNADVVLGNLEGPITLNSSVSAGTVAGSPDNYRFTMPTTTASTLAERNIKLVNMGNNHIGNFGMEGIASTQSYLAGAGVAYFGGLAGDSPVYRMNEKGMRVSFVNYDQFGGDVVEKVAALIAQEKSAGQLVVVYTHWGEEYSDDISAIRGIATTFAESGADVIMGSHPHVVLPHEYIGKTLVYYSLGNFIFDQYFNARVMNGLAVLLSVSESGIEVKEYPVALNPDGRTCPVGAAE